MLQGFEFANSSSVKALARHAAEFILGNVQPAAVFGRKTKVDAANVLARAFRFEGFIERADGVGVQVVADQRDPITIRAPSVQQTSDFLSPVEFRSVFPYGCLTPAGEWFAKHENRSRAVALVFVVDTLGMIFARRDWLTRFVDQLHRLFVHANDGLGWVVRFFIGFQHIFHVRHELGVAFRGDHPVLDALFRHAFFLAFDARSRG